MLRVLIADDSATNRALLTQILQSDSDIHVVAEAKNGLEAVELAQRLRPQVITMDIRMPRMDGFAATKEIMIVAPAPIVIVTGSSEGREVELAMHALRAGAATVLPRPAGPGAAQFDDEAHKFVATIKAMAQVKVVRRWRRSPRAEATVRPAAGNGALVTAVAIATSTGGPAALQCLLSQLPATFPAPLLVVQHISPGFTPGLVAWLNTVSALRLKVAEHGEALLRHTVYLAPDKRHLGVTQRGTILLSETPPIHGFRPSGTFLFESVASVFGSSAVAIILTGMGEDGVDGLRAVRQAGGKVIAQDEDSAVVFGMPKAAIAAGVVDVVLPLDSIAPWLVTAVGDDEPEKRKPRPVH
jgi:two-component system chemotaxis response regulator CheB